MAHLLGCIADDFAGATDLANTLTRQGMSTVVLPGVPRATLEVPEADAVVIVLDSRSSQPAAAVKMSLQALDWLKRAGARQLYFKYSWTLDSTDAGNIGAVGDALLDALRESFTVACPALPANGRTVYQGHLFLGPELLYGFGGRLRELTPTSDASLVRALQRQSSGRVGLVPFTVVDGGPDAIDAAFQALRAQGYRHAIVDALTDRHLRSIATACSGLTLVTGGSGLALGLPDNFRRQGLLRRNVRDPGTAVEGHAAVLSGSFSATTQRQIAAMKGTCETFALDPQRSLDSAKAAAEAIEWAARRLGNTPVVIYSTAPQHELSERQERVGREDPAAWFQRTLAAVANGLVERGVRRFVVAGSETSAAVVGALGIEALRVGGEIAPGVPWMTSLSNPPLALVLKPGNCGTDDFFVKAFR